MTAQFFGRLPTTSADGEQSTSKRGSPLYFQQLYDELRNQQGATSEAPIWEAAVVPTCDWFTSIVLSETMLSDHSRKVYTEAVLAVLERTD